MKTYLSTGGSFELIQATLNALIRIKQLKIDYDRVILLSGQDYPIKSNEQIDEFFKKSLHSIFLEYFPLPNFNKWGQNGGMYRLNRYFFGLTFFNRYGAKTANALLRLIPSFKRQLNVSMKPFAGSQWWVIDNYAVDYIIGFAKDKYRLQDSFGQIYFPPYYN